MTHDFMNPVLDKLETASITSNILYFFHLYRLDSHSDYQESNAHLKYWGWLVILSRLTNMEDKGETVSLYQPSTNQWLSMSPSASKNKSLLLSKNNVYLAGAQQFSRKRNKSTFFQFNLLTLKAVSILSYSVNFEPFSSVF